MTTLSITRDDKTNVHYTVFDGANGENHTETRKDNMSFWTTKRIGFCMLFQTVALLSVIFLVVGLYFDRSFNMEPISAARLTNNADHQSSNNVSPTWDVTEPELSTTTTSNEPTSEPVNREERNLKLAGVTYVRWGRTQCPDTADHVYSGFTAGAKGGVWISNEEIRVDAPGGGSNYLCLPHTPHFNQSTPGLQDTRSRIYAVEYRSANEGALNQYHTHDAPCVMCQSSGGRTQSFMMPATTDCPAGWTREYYGYLAAARFDHPRSEYVCVDSDPEVIPGTKPIEHISLLYHVEVVSSEGLPGDYVTGNDLTCAVCTM